MTLPTGQIAISDINTELGLSAGYSSSLSFLSGYLKSPPSSPSINDFRGKAYYRRNVDGNCNNGNCTAQGGPNGNCTNPNAPNGNCSNSGGPNGNCTANCNCGNIQCSNCLITGPSNCSNCQVCTAINCSNCQVCTASNCANCANCGAINCSNCDGQNYLQNNCNCACTYNCTQSAVSYNCNTSAVTYNCSTSAVSYNCVTAQTSYACNCNCNCSKIICAKLYDFGLMDQNIWAADQAYGQWLRKKDRRVYRGYVRWARIVTAWMDGKGPNYMPWILDTDKRSAAQKSAITDMAIKIGTPWSEHMAFLMGAVPEDNIQGRILMTIGKPICRFVDSLPRVGKKSRRHRLPTLYTMWALFYLSYYTSLAGSQLHSLFKGVSFNKLMQRSIK